ncbi:MAG: DUF5615 family PIN-like protein [Chloroflexota bacterium]|nr:DUF5615 family PIN-like protein [Chloroflexota bacterium]
MRLLLDSCVWGGVISVLEAAGHDVDWVGNWEEDPGDDNILAHALAFGQILVTLDKDFGNWPYLVKNLTQEYFAW